MLSKLDFHLIYKKKIKMMTNNIIKCKFININRSKSKNDSSYQKDEEIDSNT